MIVRFSYQVFFVGMFIFFFKHKTAYEMRISDWSSDVCSSDLTRPPPGKTVHTYRPTKKGAWRCRDPWRVRCRWRRARRPHRRSIRAAPSRSEEHTSELQSLMRISYAVFCLKKKQISQHKIS